MQLETAVSRVERRVNCKQSSVERIMHLGNTSSTTEEGLYCECVRVSVRVSSKIIANMGHNARKFEQTSDSLR